MKKLIALFLSIAITFALVAQQANPSFKSFHQDDFDTNNYIITANVPPTSWLPGVGYEVWYEPFSGGDVSTTEATIGALGWTEVAEGGAVGLTNEVNHWGCVALLTTASAGSQQTVFNSDGTVAAISTIPALNATVGWTNRIIWRVNVTNSIKAHLALIGTTATFGQGALQSSIGIYINSTNSTQIMGMVSHASTLSTTNLETMVNAEWHTNHIWCNSSGVISFNIDGGPEATLNSNVPTSSLQPAFAIIKTETQGGISTLQVDEWTLWWRRQ